MADVGYYLTNTYYTNVLITNIYTTNIVISSVDSNSMSLGSTNFSLSILNATEEYQNYTIASGYFYTMRQSSSTIGATNIMGGSTSMGTVFGLPFVPNAPFGNQMVAMSTNVTGPFTQPGDHGQWVPPNPATNMTTVTNTDLSVVTAPLPLIHGPISTSRTLFHPSWGIIMPVRGRSLFQICR